MAQTIRPRMVLIFTGLHPAAAHCTQRLRENSSPPKCRAHWTASHGRRLIGHTTRTTFQRAERTCSRHDVLRVIEGRDEEDDREAGEEACFTSIQPVQTCVMRSSGMKQRAACDPTACCADTDRREAYEVRNDLDQSHGWKDHEGKHEGFRIDEGCREHTVKGDGMRGNHTVILPSPKPECHLSEIEAAHNPEELPYRWMKPRSRHRDAHEESYRNEIGT